MIGPPVPIVFPNEVEWRPKLSPATVSVLLQHMATQDVFAIDRTVREALGLPNRKELSERLGDEEEDGSGGLLRLKHYRWINRALAMELLASLLLSYLNSAKKVRSFCLAREARAYYFAGPNLPDLIADYPESENAPAFRVLGEVSAKRKITPDWHLKQLEQALRHAKDEQDKSPEPQLIYAWVINNGDVGSDPALRLQYQEFVRKNGLLEEGCRIRVAPMHTRDAAFALALLCSKPPTGGFGFPSRWLAGALECMADELMKDAAPEPQGWMADLFARSVGDQGSLLPPEPPSDDDDGPPGMR